MLASPTRSALNGSDLGTGKTLAGVETALRMNANTVLVSSPLNVRWDWFDTFKRQTGYSMPVNFISNGNQYGRLSMEALKNRERGVYIVGRELFRLTDWSGVYADMVIHDETHTLSNRQSKGFAVAQDMARRTGFTIGQSATWFGSNFSGAWAIGRLLFPEQVSKSYWAWVLQYCDWVYDHFAPDNKKITGEREPGKFASELPCYVNLRQNAGDPPLSHDLYVDLLPKQRKMYDDMERRGVTWLNEHPMVAELPPTQHIRLRQLTLAECSIVDSGKMDPQGDMITQVDFLPNAKSSKFDALKELLADIPDEKVLIGTDSAKFARMVAARLGADAFAWTGDKTNTQRDKAKGRFMKGDLKYLVATQAAIGEGVNGLQEASHIMVILSQNDQQLLNMQFVGRLARKGQTKRVLVYNIIARNTLDDRQNASLLGKALSMRQSSLKEHAA